MVATTLERGSFDGRTDPFGRSHSGGFQEQFLTGRNEEYDYVNDEEENN